MAEEQKLKYTVEINKAGTGAAQAARDLQEVSKAAETSGKSLATAGREFKTAIAAVAGAAIIRESIQAFTEQDAAVRRLNGTLIALGRNGADTSRQLQQLAQSVTLPPGASRNSVLDAIAELTRNGAATSELPRLTQMVMDLAAAGYGVERAADAMGNAVAGDFGKLAKILNVDFPAAAGRANNLAEALSLLQQRFGGLAAQTAGGLGGGLAEFNENLTKIKESLGQIVLTGLEPIVRELSSAARFWAELIHGKAPAPYVRPGWAPGGPLRSVPEPANPNQFYDPATAQREMEEKRRQLALSAARNFGGQVLVGNQQGFRSSVDELKFQLDEQLNLLDQHIARGLIKEREYKDQRAAILNAYQIQAAEMGLRGMEADDALYRARISRFQAEELRVKEHYARQIDIVEAYYELLFQKRAEAGGEFMASDLEAVESERIERMAELARQSAQAQYEASFLGATLVQVGQTGAQQFASGMSNAFGQFITGAQSAEQAFRQFAASFLQQIAQMIMQALILRAVQGVFGGLGGIQGGFGALQTGVMMAASGGILPRQMAMGGVQTVSSATYFPRFNAVAGEAGSEVLAVLSKPRFMAIGGLQSYVGSVQGSELAMTNARDLRSAIGNRQSPIGGEIVVVVRGTKDFEARVVDSSIEGALVRVHNDVLQDTGLRSAIKEVSA